MKPKKYKVTIIFKSETNRIHRKQFIYEEKISNSYYELFKYANMFGAEKIIFEKMEK